MNKEIATFAGGCFWCIEHLFEELPGVISAISGYAGGDQRTATYDQVASRKTKHKEAVQVTFDPEVITYEQLLHHFWRNIDPTDDGGQFADRGPEYMTEIMYHNEAQREAAAQSKKELEESQIFDGPIVTTIVPATTFFPAEEEMQGYAKRCPIAYGRYRIGSGRAAYLDKLWGEKK